MPDRLDKIDQYEIKTVPAASVAYSHRLPDSKSRRAFECYSNPVSDFDTHTNSCTNRDSHTDADRFADCYANASAARLTRVDHFH